MISLEAPGEQAVQHHCTAFQRARGRCVVAAHPAAQVQGGVGHKPGRDGVAQPNAFQPGRGRAERVPEADQVAVKIAQTGGDQDRGGDEEIARGHLDIHQR